MVIWVTGISGSGKSTVCKKIFQMAKPYIPELIWLDGDVVRYLFNDTLGHSEKDRVKQIKRIQRLAKELDAQEMVVLVAALYSHPELLSWNKTHFSDYSEIYLEASLKLVKERDPKGLYAKLQSSDTPNVVGIDIPWHIPQNPTFKFKMEREITPETSAEKIIRAIPSLSSRLLMTLSDD